MLRLSVVRTGFLFFVSCLVAWGQNAGTLGEITGTVLYRERIVLRSDAIVHVQLQDVSLQDAPAKVLAEVKIPAAGKQVPIEFRIPYTQADINPAHSYAVSATILLKGKMIFTSTRVYPVITRGAATKVSILVQSADANRAPSPRQNQTARLEGTDWKLIQIGSTQAVSGSEAASANLVLIADGNKLTGSSCCNRLLGTYDLNKDSLRFKPVGLKRMACPEPLMKQEQALTEALKATTSYRIRCETLELRNGDRVLARFQSQRAK